MKKLLQKALDGLKNHVHHNLIEIRKSQMVIRDILQEPVSSDRSDKLDREYKSNKELLKENQDFINLQLTIVSFIEKYSSIIDEGGDEKIFPDEVSEFISPDEKELSPETGPDSDDVLFEKTITGQLEYNIFHPRYKNEEFFARLLKYYQEKEDYEQCSILVNVNNNRTI
ncbi:MAG: hypothetical protein ACOCYF_00115 [Bacteroidota bacterium]